MKTIELSQIAAIAPHVSSGSQEPVIVLQDGHTVAAIVPANEEDVENLMLSVNSEFQSILERSQRRLESEGPLTSKEVRSRLGLPSSSPDK
ncbi:MAG TPA: hypothetical protein VFE46_07320 [Pirellulales bacterium]|jgi:antitoxin (DNA-binding transcriptional repressor) of toxin-antitoxin stability system|nr:hypothetical protein [Pirellulales bacterium]